MAELFVYTVRQFPLARTWCLLALHTSQTFHQPTIIYFDHLRGKGFTSETGKKREFIQAGTPVICVIGINALVSR